MGLFLGFPIIKPSEKSKPKRVAKQANVAHADAHLTDDLPGTHGVDGPTFGGLVSGLAKTNHAALVMYIMEACVNP